MKNLKVLYIEPELHSKTKALAAENKMTLSAYVEKALLAFKDRSNCEHCSYDDGTPC